MDIIYISVIKIEGDPYCTQAYDVIERLKKDFPTVEVEVIDAKIQSELAEKFADDYRYVPTIFIEGKKVYESHPGESFEECFESFKKVFESAV